MELLVLLVLIGSDLIRKHAASRHVSLGVVNIRNDLDGRVVETALLRLVVVRFRLGGLERRGSL